MKGNVWAALFGGQPSSGLEEGLLELDFSQMHLGKLIGRGGQASVFEGTFTGLPCAFK